jgi:kinesin family protein C1
MAIPRPATAMESHSSEEDLPAQGKRKGMIHSTSIPLSYQSSQECSTLQSRKLRAPHSMQPLRSLSLVHNMRDVSVSTAMSMLRIDEQPNPCLENQAISPTMKPSTPPYLCRRPSISTGLRSLRIDSTETALVLFQVPRDSLVASKTPSQVPVLCKTEVALAIPATPRKTPKSSPQKPSYLTKDSNIPAFTAWDVRGRLEDMEAMYSELKDKFSGTNIERNGLEEAVGLFKARSKSFSVPYCRRKG